MRPRWKDILVRSTLLFLVSVALVVGFWYHTEFYRFGLLPLLAIGGLATFLVIAALRFILSGTLSGYWAFDEFVLSFAEAERVARHPATGVIVPENAPTPHLGKVVRIVTKSGAVFGKGRVVNAYRALLGDLTLEDLKRCSWEDAATFRKAWESWRPWRTEEPVTVVSLCQLGGRFQ